MNRRSVLISVLVAVIVILVIFWPKKDNVTVEEIKTELTVSTLSQQDSKPSEDDLRGQRKAEVLAFAKETLFPILDDITLNYPIEDLRVEFAEFWTASKAGDPLPLMMTESNSFAFAAIIFDGTQNRLTFFYPDVSYGYAMTRDGKEDLFEDMLVHYLLHEKYHHDHHQDPNQPLTERESEAWLDTCGRVDRQIFEGGRFQQVPSRSSIMVAKAAYDLSGGDPNSDVWQKFIQVAIGQAPVASLYYLL